MNTKTVKQILQKIAKTIKNPTTELNYSSNFELLIAVLLSARTTDKSVNAVTARLFKVANTPEKILRLGNAGVKRHIKSIGFYNTKALNIIKTCKILANKFHSHIPKNRKDLESLPGVGPKTASAILNIAFGEPTIAVDTHVFRVANRIGLARGKKPEEIAERLLKIIPKKFAKTAGNMLLLHGRYVCTARNPKCPVCVVNKLCEYKFKTL